MLTATLDRGAESVAHVLHDAVRCGATVRSILSGLVPGIATELGQRWVDDDLSFLEVTIGASKLQRAIHDLPRLAAGRREQMGRRVLVTTPPGEQHALGAAVIAQLLWLEGCQSSVDVRGSRGVNDQAAIGYDLVAISVASERGRQTLPEMVGRIRDGAGHHACPIVLGGINASVELSDWAGADGHAPDLDDVMRRLGGQGARHG